MGIELNKNVCLGLPRMGFELVVTLNNKKPSRLDLKKKIKNNLKRRLNQMSRFVFSSLRLYCIAWFSCLNFGPVLEMDQSLQFDMIYLREL